MNNVRKHVEKLFANYPVTADTLDLKEEVIGNLEAEIEDLQSSGVSFEEAFRISIGKMSKLDELIDGVKFISVRKIVFDMLQWTLIYTLLAWILTIPLSIFGPIRKISWLLFFIVISIVFCILLLRLTRGVLLKGRVSIDLFKTASLKKKIWIMWSIFVFLSWGIITGLIFGSDIWFSRKITINGPYQFAIVATQYFAPLITIIIPLLIDRLKMYVEQHEGEANEANEK